MWLSLKQNNYFKNLEIKNNKITPQKVTTNADKAETPRSKENPVNPMKKSSKKNKRGSLQA